MLLIFTPVKRDIYTRTLNMDKHVLQLQHLHFSFLFFCHITKCCSYSCSYWESTAGFWLLAVFFFRFVGLCGWIPLAITTPPHKAVHPSVYKFPKRLGNGREPKQEIRPGEKKMHAESQRETDSSPGCGLHQNMVGIYSSLLLTCKYYRCEKTAHCHTRNKTTWFIEACCFFSSL